MIRDDTSQHNKQTPKYLPPAYVLGCVAFLRLLVVDLADLAAQITGLHSIQAHVEALAVVGVSELGVGDDLPLRICDLLLRAFEAILQFLCGIEEVYFVKAGSKKSKNIANCYERCDAITAALTKTKDYLTSSIKKAERTLRW